jgi:hypothetical protein
MYSLSGYMYMLKMTIFGSRTSQAVGQRRQIRPIPSKSVHSSPKIYLLCTFVLFDLARRTGFICVSHYLPTGQAGAHRNTI